MVQWSGDFSLYGWVDSDKDGLTIQWCNGQVTSRLEWSTPIRTSWLRSDARFKWFLALSGGTTPIRTSGLIRSDAMVRWFLALWVDLWSLLSSHCQWIEWRERPNADNTWRSIFSIIVVSCVFGLKVFTTILTFNYGAPLHGDPPLPLDPPHIYGVVTY